MMKSETLMVRTHVQFDDQQYEQIRQLAHRQRTSISEMVRRLVRAGMRKGGEPGAGKGPQALLGIAGIGESGLGDLGRRHDHYLADEPSE